MNYQETIAFLYSRLPMFSRMGSSALKSGLNNIHTLCDFLGNPQHQFKSVHIAGTNGKGSVSHMLAAIFQTAGYKTGLYTSPHLKDFRERIKVQGHMIPEDFVIDFTQKISPLIEKIHPSFFEITVAMAFEFFSNQKIEMAIIETGLGGRLDSTNIIQPEASIITNIGWDHMNILGDTLQKIAEEKAGIIKNETPVILGNTTSETLPVFIRIAKEKNATLHLSEQKRQVMEWGWKDHLLVLEIAGRHKTDHQVYHLDLPGLYQKDNVLTVLEACSVLKEKGWSLPDEAIKKGLRNTKKITGLQGRWQTIHTKPQVILDVAHNIDGIKLLLQQVELTDHRDLHLVMGMVKDKPLEELLSILPQGAYYYFTKAQIPRALPEYELALMARQKGLRGEAYPDVNKALRHAMAKAHPDDLVIVCGSVYLVGEVTEFYSQKTTI